MKGRKTGGRTKGTPNKITALKEAAQAYTSEALETLADIMRNGQSDQAKVAAANSLLDRGHGKPQQSLDVTSEKHVYVHRTPEPIESTDEWLKQYAPPVTIQ